MESKASYPKDFRDALRKKLSNVELDHLSQPPLFVYNYLMLPSVLKYVLGTGAPSTRDSANSMMSTSLLLTQATLLDHALYQFGSSPFNASSEDVKFPAVVSLDKAECFVDGMLIFGLTPEQRGSIHDFESDHSMQLENVKVELCLEDGELRTMDAGTSVWRGDKTAMEKYDHTSWGVDGFLTGKMYQDMMRRMDRMEDIDEED